MKRSAMRDGVGWRRFVVWLHPTPLAARATHERASLVSDPSRGGLEKSAQMTIFWHCGLPAFSSKTRSETRFRQPTVNGLGRGCRSTGSGDADSQRMVRSSGGSGFGRRSLRDSGCVRAHPADWRASASYRPLRAVWAFAPGHSGVARDHQNPSALEKAAHDHKEFSQ
jgi:hypothetical protein